MPQKPFPVPDAADTEDVAWAVETAGALWGRGDAREAIRWLRRAAETASDAGLDMRALDLARMAADLATELQLPPSMPPPPVAPDELSESTEQDLATGANRRGTLQTPALSPEMALGAHDRRTPPDVLTPRVEPGRADARDWADRTVADEQEEEPTERGGDPTSNQRPITAMQRQALRCAVTPTEEPGLLLVRVLDDLDDVPRGAHEAILVALDARTDLSTRKR